MSYIFLIVSIDIQITRNKSLKSLIDTSDPLSSCLGLVITTSKKAFHVEAKKNKNVATVTAKNALLF